MNEENKIRQQFQSKLNDLRAPVPEDGWQRLEQSLAATSAAKVIRRRWYIGSAAAVLVMLIGSLLFMQNPQQEIAPTIAETVTPPTEQKHDKITKETTAQPIEPLLAQQQADVKKGVSGKNYKTKTLSTPSEKGEVKNPIIAFIRKQAEKSIVQTTKTEDENIQQFDDTEKERLIEDFIRAGEREELLLAEAFSGNDNRKMMLSLSGRGGLTSFQKTVNSPMTLRSAAVADESTDNLLNRSPMALAMSNTANNIAEMEHSQPVSVGLVVSKSIFDDLSIETGLVYTYLYSKARNTNIASKIQETQQFHYIGVPLNVNYDVISFRNLDVYVSLGGMVEKDFAGKREYMAETVTELNSTGEEQITEKIRQNNYQYSVNAGVGLSYPVYNKLNLYGKVGGSYYFDAENPYNTIYSDKKIMLDLNVGLRYEF